MMKLSNIRIPVRIAIACLLPLLAFTVLTGMQLLDKRAVVSDMNAIAVVAEAAPMISALAHELQKERAASDVEESRQTDYLKDEVAIRLSERLLVRSDSISSPRSELNTDCYRTLIDTFLESWTTAPTHAISRALWSAKIPILIPKPPYPNLSQPASQTSLRPTHLRSCCSAMLMNRSTRRSISPSSADSPRATDPKIRTFRAPCR